MKKSRAEYWLDEFKGQLTNLDCQMERLKALRDDHFGYDLKALNANHVGQLKHVILQLQELNDLFDEV